MIGTMGEREALALETAKAVADELRPILEPARLPDQVVEWFKNLAKHGQVSLAWTMPIGYLGPILYVKIHPDGKMDLELADVNASIFWRITLRGQA